MRATKSIFLFAVLILASTAGFPQCADPLNIYSFVHNGHSYEVVKENRTWTEAAICAVSLDGYLAEINDEAEQNAIINELTNNAGIIISNTENQFGNASMWIGGSYAGTEGNWIWDGDNDGIGPQFWSGGPNGMPIGGLYTNWGFSPPEPDNSGGQDHLTIIVNPSSVNYSLWNDLNSTDDLYYLIEHSIILNVHGQELKSNLSIYPNPFDNYVSIENNNSIAIDGIDIVDLTGQMVKAVGVDDLNNSAIDVSTLGPGLYILNVHFVDGVSISSKVVK